MGAGVGVLAEAGVEGGGDEVTQAAADDVRLELDLREHGVATQRRDLALGGEHRQRLEVGGGDPQAVARQWACEHDLRQGLLDVGDRAAAALGREHDAGHAEHGGGVTGRELLSGLVVLARGGRVLAGAGHLAAQEQRLRVLVLVAELLVDLRGLDRVGVRGAEVALLERDDAEHVSERGVGVTAVPGEQQERLGGGAGVLGHLHAGPQIGEVGGQVALGGEGGEVALEDALGHPGHLIVGGAAGRVGGDAGPGDAGLDLQRGLLGGHGEVEVGEQGLDGDVAGLDLRVLAEVAAAGRLGLGGEVLEAPHDAADAPREVEGREVGPRDRDPVPALAVGGHGEAPVGGLRLAVA